MPFKKYLTTNNVVFLILVIIALAFISQIKVIALLFFASFVISCSLNPIVDKLEKKMKRPSAASLVIFATLAISFAFFVPIIFIAVKQVHGFLTILPEKLAFLENYIYTHSFYGHKIPEMIDFNSLIKSSSPFATGLLHQSINLTIAIGQSILFFLAICMIVFYFLADKDVIKNGMIKIFPKKLQDNASNIYEDISQKVGGYVIAQLLNMLAIGVLTAIAMFLVKVDYALLLGLITGVLDIIPLIGPTIALILCLLMANQMGLLGFGLVILAFLTAQWISNNLVRPVIFGKFLDLHPLIIIFALLVAAQFLGVWGVILAPALASLVCVLFDEIYIKMINDNDNDNDNE